jgi:ribosomal-protein-alanine N-acetyltransferase
LTTPSFVIRPAGEGDILAVSRIERDSFADPWSIESFRSSLDRERMRFLVAESRDAGTTSGTPLLGYVIALLLSGEAEIADIAVAPAARRQGIGGVLLDAMLDEATAEGVRTMYLEVRESNASARALYATRQFREVGRRKGYYHHPSEDALLLRRDLGTT